MILEVVENTPNILLDSVSQHDRMLPMSTTINFRLDAKLRRELEKLAKGDRRKLGDYVRLLCERHVLDSTRVNDSRPKASVAS
jgi:hypothetical protein